MDWQNPDDLLAWDIQFALQQFKYRPPPRFDSDPNARDRYYRSVALAVKDQIKLSWAYALKADAEKAGEIAPGLRSMMAKADVNPEPQDGELTRAHIPRLEPQKPAIS